MAHDDQSKTDATSSSAGDDVKIDWNAVAKLGVPAVIALYLVFRLANGIDVMTAEHSTLASGMTAIKEIAGQSDMAQQQILYVLQTMCANQARTDAQREGCLKRIDTRTR